MLFQVSRSDFKQHRSILELSLLALTFFLLVFFSGYNNAKATEKKTLSERQLVYASTKDIRNINPHLYGGEMAAQNMVFEPLVVNTLDGLKPCLAKTWEISEDGKVYTFNLREGVKSTDGSP